MVVELANLSMAILNVAEWLIIIIIIAAIIFGAKRIPDLARSFGKATSEFEKAKIESKRELQQLKEQETATNINGARQSRQKLESLATTLGIDYSKMNDEELRSAIQAEINKGRNTD